MVYSKWHCILSGEVGVIAQTSTRKPTLICQGIDTRCIKFPGGGTEEPLSGILPSVGSVDVRNSMQVPLDVVSCKCHKSSTNNNFSRAKARYFGERDIVYLGLGCGDLAPLHPMPPRWSYADVHILGAQELKTHKSIIAT